MKRERAGFTLVEIMVVVAIIGLLASIAVPGLLNSIEEARRRTCAANLKQIEGAKLRWALSHQKTGADVPDETDLFGKTRELPKRPVCPSGGSYTINAVESDPACSVTGHSL